MSTALATDGKEKRVAQEGNPRVMVAPEKVVTPQEVYVDQSVEEGKLYQPLAVPVPVVPEIKKSSSTSEIQPDNSSISKYNYIFYFIYKYKYENRLGSEDNDQLSAGE